MTGRPSSVLKLLQNALEIMFSGSGSFEMLFNFLVLENNFPRGAGL